MSSVILDFLLICLLFPCIAHFHFIIVVLFYWNLAVFITCYWNIKLTYLLTNYTSARARIVSNFCGSESANVGSVVPASTSQPGAAPGYRSALVGGVDGLVSLAQRCHRPRRQLAQRAVQVAPNEPELFICPQSAAVSRCLAPLLTRLTNLFSFSWQCNTLHQWWVKFSIRCT